MMKCAWCGKKNASAWKEGFCFCKKCYLVMRVSKIELGRYLLEQEKESQIELTQTSTS